MAKATFSAELVSHLPPVKAGSRKYRLQDTKCAGFALEVRSSGTSNYLVRLTDPRGRRREIGLGRTDIVSVAQARKRAVELKAMASLGGDPAADRDRLRAIPTFRVFVTTRFLPHVRERLRSASDYEAMLRLRLTPALGNKPIDQIVPEDVEALRRKMIGQELSNGRVNRHLALLRRVFNLALHWGVFQGRNPAKSPGMLQEQARQLFLDEAALRRLTSVLRDEADVAAAAAITLLALTGARKNEVLAARWEHVDYEGRRLTVPRAKSGRRHEVVLSDEAIAVLRNLPREPGQTYLFPSSRRSDQPRGGLRNTWARAKAAAELPSGLRLHDLRHTFASVLINNNVPLYDIGRMLGHSQLSTTARYAHLCAGRLIAAANTAGRVAAGVMHETDPSHPSPNRNKENAE